MFQMIHRHFNQWFTKQRKQFTNKLVRVKNKKRLSRIFPDSEIKPIIRYNRNTLKKVQNWITDEVHDGSIFNYGLGLYPNSSIRPLINKDIGTYITYTDAMLYLSHRLRQPINYLEIGVSVGKNFFQVANYLHNSALWGIDIEEINPILEKFFTRKQRFTWDKVWKRNIKTRKKKPVKEGVSSITFYEYGPNNNQIVYISADIFDEESWVRLAGQKFNLIFSDAFHDSNALLYEYDMLKKYNLINK